MFTDIRYGCAHAYPRNRREHRHIQRGQRGPPEAASFPEPDLLVAVGMTETRQKSQADLNSLSYPDSFDFREQNRTLANSAVYSDRSFALTSEEGATSLRGVKVTAEFFDVLGIKPKMGRAFVRDDERGGGGFKVVVG